MLSKPVLALYDFASKQEFIYRTAKIKEISGASEMLSGMYRTFVDVLEKEKVFLKYDLKDEFNYTAFADNNAIIGEVLYDGGGNLMVLFKEMEAYINANKIISKHLLENYPTLKMISCCVDVTGDFEADRRNLYTENARRKNRFPTPEISSVTPFSQTDSNTFLPVVYKDVEFGKEQSLSADRVAKLKAFKKLKSNKLDSLDGLVAVIYIDGNSMGNKLIKCSSKDYNDGVKKLRSFSKQVNEIYVEKPIDAIQKTIADSQYNGFRKVIGGGDEITILCDARIALKVVEVYFNILAREKIIINEEKISCTACAGVAIFHGKSPFSTAYEIAEAACESAKEKAHIKDGNYLDFHYCHAGITNNFEAIREFEQKGLTRRPYEFDLKRNEKGEFEGFVDFNRYRALLRMSGRANVKALGNAAQQSFEKYCVEAKRVNAYLPKKFNGRYKCNLNEMKIVYDMAEFYDVWFAKGDIK